MDIIKIITLFFFYLLCICTKIIVRVLGIKDHYLVVFLVLGLGTVPDLKLFLALRGMVFRYLILPVPVPLLLYTLVPHPTSNEL